MSQPQFANYTLPDRIEAINTAVTTINSAVAGLQAGIDNTLRPYQPTATLLVAKTQECTITAATSIQKATTFLVPRDGLYKVKATINTAISGCYAYVCALTAESATMIDTSLVHGLSPGAIVAGIATPSGVQVIKTNAASGVFEKDIMLSAGTLLFFGFGTSNNSNSGIVRFDMYGGQV